MDENEDCPDLYEDDWEDWRKHRTYDPSEII